MVQHSPRTRSRTVLLWISVGLLALSMPCLGLGVLGLLGIVADVSPAENREMGLQFLRLALIPFGLGVAALLTARLTRRSA